MDTGSGRTFCVKKDGTLVMMSKNPDVDLNALQNSTYGKPTMKVILSNAASESFREQLKYPSVARAQNNINDSLNIRDFVEYGAKSNSERKNHQNYAQTSVDVRKWR